MRFVLAAALLAAATPSLAQPTPVESRNKAIVAAAYDAWTKGGTRFFDILSPDVRWTILGEGPSAVTYTSKADFLAGAVAPFAARLSVPLRPTVQRIHADGDQVVALWDGRATTRDGRPYRNTYAWFFTMRGGKAVEVKALLNLAAYDEVLRRVAPAPNR